MLHAWQASKGGMSPVELVPKHGNRSLGSQASLRASLVLCTLCDPIIVGLVH